MTTDFETHRLWVNQPCDHYFTATEEGARYLAHWGVPAEDVTVTVGALPSSSARNHLAGRITEVRPAGPVSRVVLECGFTLIALVTRQAAQDLGLRPGALVTATVKASTIHLIPR